jgi:hypothetical protein
MVSFAFSEDELRTAPPEVRRWIEARVLTGLGMRPGAEARPSAPEHGTLADCTPEEMAQVLNSISENVLVTRVFFELGRDAADGPKVAPYRALSLAEIQRHVQLPEARQLFACLGAINEALQHVRGDPGAAIFGFDDGGHVYLHETTHRSIRHLWEQLVHAHVAAVRGSGAEAGAPEFVTGGGQEPVMHPEHAFPSGAPL